MTLKILKLSLKAIWYNKMRSVLTMLGIIIGVMAVVILVSITQGATDGITGSISDMGSDRITATITSEGTSLSVEAVGQLTDYAMIDSVAPVISVSKTAKKGTNSGNYSVYGITPDYLPYRTLTCSADGSLWIRIWSGQPGCASSGPMWQAICLAPGTRWRVR